jgi:hypothetical protein
MNQKFVSGIFRHDPESINAIIDNISAIQGDCVIISVGSGNGHLETILKKNTGRKIICCDPLKTSYNLPSNFTKSTDQFIYPDYDTVDNIEALETHIGNCIVLISWPFYQSNMSGNTYDYDALIKSRPILFIINYGPCGCSGSDALINLLSSDPCVDNFFNVPPPPKKHITIATECYELKINYNYTVGTGFGMNGKTIRLVSYVKSDNATVVPSCTYNRYALGSNLLQLLQKRERTYLPFV